MAITTLEKTKILFGITTSTYDTRITALIPLIEEEYLEIRNKPFETDELENIVYPQNSELTAIKMIGYNLFNINNLYKSSESLGDYSVSFQGTAGTSNYPASITGAIRKFARAI